MAKKATLYLVGDTEGTTEYLKTVKDITVKCRKASGDWFSPSQEKIKNAVEVSGLEPGTDYIFKAVIDGNQYNITVKNEVIRKNRGSTLYPIPVLKTGIQIPIHGGLQGLLEISPTIFITLILKVLLIYGGIQTTNIPSMGCGTGTDNNLSGRYLL